jgi:hypothetical protein
MTTTIAPVDTHTWKVFQSGPPGARVSKVLCSVCGCAYHGDPSDEPGCAVYPVCGK